VNFISDPSIPGNQAARIAAFNRLDRKKAKEKFLKNWRPANLELAKQPIG
jgi:hypothetical protein